MSSDIVIKAENISKVYYLCEKPHQRLKQIISSYLKEKMNFKSSKSTDDILDDKYKSKEFWALKNVSVELNKNETLGIIGQNGSGKSTLLQIICETLSPTSGTTNVNGRVAALLELGAGFNPEFTGRENVYLNASIYGLSSKEINFIMDKIIEFAEIGEHIDQPVKTYSSGMYVRLAFSVIANVDADILVIDEALAVGDAYFQQKCMRFLRKFKEKGSIFFVSHDTGAMMNFCDKVVWIHKGAVIACGDPKVVCEEYLSFLYQEHTGQYTEELLNNKTSSDTPSNLNGLKYIENVNDLLVSNNSISESQSFGDMKAVITHCELLNNKGQSINVIYNQTLVTLFVSFNVRANLKSVIVGFIVKDRLGQYIFGDNTFGNISDKLINMNDGESANAEFKFEMPAFSPGVYSIVISIASGDLQEHIQHHWVHDAIIFNSITDINSGVMMRLPMREIKFMIDKDRCVF